MSEKGRDEGGIFWIPPLFMSLNHRSLSVKRERWEGFVACCMYWPFIPFQNFDGDDSGNREAKHHYLKDYWITAANNLKTFGRWQLLEVRDID